MQLAGKRIIVTGGSSGIGAATVRAYAAEGANVVCVDVDDAGGEVVAKEAGAIYYRCDVSDAAQVNEVFEAASAELGGVDVLDNIAGIEPSSPAEATPESEWDLVLGVNAKGTMLTNQAAFRAMQAGGGAIINFASPAGIEGQAGSAAYAASKGAVLGWSRTVAHEWGPYPIRVNAIAPVMNTPMFQRHRERPTAEDRQSIDCLIVAHIPLGCTPGDA